VAPAMASRNGGYTRIIKTAKWRIGDGGDIVIVQLVGVEKSSKPGKKEDKKAEAKA